jgi:hypothetical protein
MLRKPQLHTWVCSPEESLGELLRRKILSTSFSDSIINSGTNPTIASYNASVVNFYNAMGSLTSFEKKIF